jgi:hypothetical protein
VAFDCPEPPRANEEREEEEEEEEEEEVARLSNKHLRRTQVDRG